LLDAVNLGAMLSDGFFNGELQRLMGGRAAAAGSEQLHVSYAIFDPHQPNVAPVGFDIWTHFGERGLRAPENLVRPGGDFHDLPKTVARRLPLQSEVSCTAGVETASG
jgi:hypothetical protein